MKHKKSQHMDGHEGMHVDGSHVRHHLAMEHARHSERMHHESSMHGLYRHEEDFPRQNPQGHPEHAHGMDDWKGQAMDIAYGQAGHAGCMADDKRLRSQHKNYHWADSPAVEAPGAY